MLLLVDAGNTRVKWALLDPRDDTPPGRWRDSGAMARGELAQLEQAWRGRGIERALMANVAGAATGAALERTLALAAPAAVLEWFQSVPRRGGVENRYREPARLGCDRFAAAIGAHALWPGQALVVATCGTATTVDAISADGAFLGGMILPGLELMTAALAQHTAQLPRVAHGPLRAGAFADNTDDAITSGCLAAQAGAIDRAVAARGGPGVARCVLAGGAAAWIAPHLAVPHARADNLVLTGLQVVTRLEQAC
ncbi:MAG: type III pantothenate kinase [Noviherbaspirillum sp.]